MSDMSRGGDFCNAQLPQILRNVEFGKVGFLSYGTVRGIVPKAGCRSGRSGVNAGEGVGDDRRGDIGPCAA